MVNSSNVIIWDWNGTLLDDLKISIMAMNSMLEERNLSLLTEMRYKDIFCFPVRLYYEKIGFDFNKESFECVGLDYMERYKKLLPQAFLTNHAIEVLEKCRQLGCKQFVLSSMKQALLCQMLKDYGIIQFFDTVYGIGDDYGGGKLNEGMKLMQEKRINSQLAVMIGDTVHDAEVSDKMNIKCILFSKGHQSEMQLRKANSIIIDDLRALLH